MEKIGGEDLANNNICIIFDFENIEVNLREKYKLSLKEDGFIKIIENIKTKGNAKIKNILVGAYWNNFISQKSFVIRSGKTIDVICNTKSAADGALVVEVLKLFIGQQSEEIDTFVLVAGDGGYGNLIQFLLEEEKKVHLLSIKRSLNSDLKKLIGEVEWIDTILGIVDENNYDINYVTPLGLTEDVKSVIRKARGLLTRLPHLNKGYLIKQLLIASTKHPPLNPYNTEAKCTELVNKCCELGIFQEYTHQIENGKDIPALKLDEMHILVLEVK